MSSELWLYFRRRQAGNAGASAGRLLINDVEASTVTGSLVIRLEFLPSTDSSDPENPTNWVSLNATIRTQISPIQEVGTVKIDHPNQPPFPPTPPNLSTSVQWSWQLLPRDVEVIERIRSLSPSSPIHLQLAVDGIAQTSSGVLGVAGDGTFRIELSHWHRLLEQMGYSMSPSMLATLSSGSLDEPSFREAAKRLEVARQHLRRGEDYAALEGCLGQLEALATAPYRQESWKALLEKLPEQKAESLAKWIAGLATYLNRVGHHRSREERDEDGDLAIMPLNHWESELAVASTQIALSYLLRLDGR